MPLNTIMTTANMVARARNETGGPPPAQLPQPNSPRLEERLSRADPQSAGVRRGGRVAARARARAFQTPGEPPAPQARGPAGGILVQAARRLQQDGGAARGE